MADGGYSFFNFYGNSRLTALDATVQVTFRKAISAAESDVRSKYEANKRPLVDTITMPGGGDTGNMEYVLATMEGDLKDASDGTIPEFSPDAASVRSEAKPNAFIVSIYEYQLDDDKYQILAQSIKLVASKAVRWKYKAIGKGIIGLLSSKTVDGLSYFNTGHYVNLRNADAGTFSNKASLVLTDDNYVTARQGMRSIPMEDGEPTYDNVPTIMVTSSKLEQKAKNILYVPRVFGGADNPNLGSSELVVVPEFDVMARPGGGTYENFWALFKADDSACKPLIWNERLAPRITMIEPRTTAKGRQYRWLVDARAELAGFEPRMGYASDPAP